MILETRRPSVVAVGDTACRVAGITAKKLRCDSERDFDWFAVCGSRLEDLGEPHKTWWATAEFCLTPRRPFLGEAPLRVELVGILSQMFQYGLADKASRSELVLLLSLDDQFSLHMADVVLQEPLICDGAQVFLIKSRWQQQVSMLDQYRLYCRLGGLLGSLRDVLVVDSRPINSAHGDPQIRNRSMANVLAAYVLDSKRRVGDVSWPRVVECVER